MTDPTWIKTRLPRTWPIFFARHGSFTSVQEQAIPAILDGRNTLIVSATASGKTEAAIAPLLERHILKRGRTAGRLQILYICPTKALVRDLYERLRQPLDRLGVTVKMKSGESCHHHLRERFQSSRVLRDG